MMRAPRRHLQSVPSATAAPRPGEQFFTAIRQKASRLAEVIDSGADLSDDVDRAELAELAYEIYALADAALEFGYAKGGA